jgi:hypothetical protein
MRKAAITVTRRGESKPPRDLARFIELVNMERLYERELDDIQARLDAATDDPENAPNSLRNLWVRICGQTAAQLDPETREFLGSPSDFQQFIGKYELLSSAAKVLHSIGKRNAKGPSGYASKLMIHDPQWPAELPFTVSIDLVVDERGRLGVTENPLLKSLVGIPIERIRSCAVCRRFFWAPRVNSECCSGRCRKSYNQRNSREARRKLLANKKPRSRKGR